MSRPMRPRNETVVPPIVWVESPARALAWDVRSGALTELPSLGGVDPPFPNDINNRGQIVGVSSNASSRLHAVLWEPRRGPRE
jgi:probable HAF family extracellular repeat protein